MAFPLLRLVLNRGKFEEKKAKKIALWNSIVLGSLFCILTSAVTDSSSAWNAAPAVLYYWINCALLTSKAEKQKNQSTENTSPVSHTAAPHDLGIDPQIVYCRKCGSKLSSDSNFCSKCGGKICAETPEPAPVTASSVDAEDQYTAAALNKSSHRSDPWEVNHPTPKRNFAKKAAFLSCILLIITVGVILFMRNNGQSDYYYDSTNNGNAPSADSVDPYDEKRYDVKKIRISADSSSGVGDVYSMRIEHQDYHIYDNQIGQVYEVNYKTIGGVGQTGVSNIGGYLLPVYGQTNDWWYCVVLPDGTTGFVWGGADGMYVDEIG